MFMYLRILIGQFNRAHECIEIVKNISTICQRNTYGV